MKPTLTNLSAKGIVDYVNQLAFNRIDIGCTAVYIYDVFKFFNIPNVEEEIIKMCNNLTRSIMTTTNRHGGGSFSEADSPTFQDWLRLEIIDKRPCLTISQVQDDFKPGKKLLDLLQVSVNQVFIEVDRGLHYILRGGYIKKDATNYPAFFAVGVIACDYRDKLTTTLDPEQAISKIEREHPNQLVCLFGNKPSKSVRLTCNLQDLSGELNYTGTMTFMHGEK